MVSTGPGSARRRELARQHHARQEARRRAERERAARRRRTTVAVVASVVSIALVAGLVAWAVSTARRDGGPAADRSPAAQGCSWQPAEDPGRAVDPPPTTPDTPGPSRATLRLRGLGAVTLRLDGAAAPCATTSFRHLAATGYFDATRCHRLTTSASLKVLQCGASSGNSDDGPGYSFADENLTGAAYPAGTVAMANSGPDTNGSQFFLVYGKTTLPPSYTPFGTVVGGLDVLRRVAAKGVRGGGEDGEPAVPVVITGVQMSPPVASAPSPSAASPSPSAARS